MLQGKNFKMITKAVRERREQEKGDHHRQSDGAFPNLPEPNDAKWNNKLQGAPLHHTRNRVDQVFPAKLAVSYSAAECALLRPLRRDLR